MPDVYKLFGGAEKPEDVPSQIEFDRFLAEEGLELLASYRSIPDAELRRQIRDLVFKISTTAH